MNMTVLFKKCTYGLLLTTLVIGSFCSSLYVNRVDVVSNGTFRANAGSNSFGFTIEAGHLLSVQNTTQSKVTCVLSGSNLSVDRNGTMILVNTGSSDITIYFNCTNGLSTSRDIPYGYFDIGQNFTCSSCPTCPTCEECEECNECPTIDSQYCTDNNLCPSCEGTGSSCEEGDGNRSALYINDIQHPGSALINITIPEELQRNYTGDEEEMNIDVEGYGYDQEKMQELVNTQYYTPTTEDMGNLVSKIADFLPLLAIMLLVIRTWYLIKKVF